MFIIFRDIKAVCIFSRFSSETVVQNSALFLPSKIARFASKSASSDIHARKRAKKKKKCVLSFSVIGCGLTTEIYPSEKVFLHRERYAAWVFFVRVERFSLFVWSSPRVKVALFLGMRIGNNCVTPLLLFNQESVVLVRRAFSVGVRGETNEN